MVWRGEVLYTDSDLEDGERTQDAQHTHRVPIGSGGTEIARVRAHGNIRLVGGSNERKCDAIELGVK